MRAVNETHLEHKKEYCICRSHQQLCAFKRELLQFLCLNIKKTIHKVTFICLWADV